MVVSEAAINNIMGGLENTGDVRLHNHRRKLTQRFDIIRKLGQGTYGKVQLGINKETGQEVAIKTIRKNKIETEADLVRIRREIQIMSSVRHPNIIHIYEVFENREKIVLVMEYAAGGELYDYLSERKVLSEDEARRIFRQISTAVYYCHKNNICHRDLKLENILLDEQGNAKIADFGLSNVFSFNSLLSTFCGSPLYASPEIVKGTPYYGPEVDCWSLGVLLYTLVYGAMPFDGSNFKRLVRQISQGEFFEPKTPSPASSLIGEMLNVDPMRRADIEVICSNWWINDSYKEPCLEVAQKLASQTPVRLDLLLSLSPAVNSEQLVIPEEQMPPDTVDHISRSQSLGSIPPQVEVTPIVNSPLEETKPSNVGTDDAKPKAKKKERSTSKTGGKSERPKSKTRKASDASKVSDVNARDAPAAKSDENSNEIKDIRKDSTVVLKESKPDLEDEKKLIMGEKKMVSSGRGSVSKAKEEFERRASLADSTIPKTTCTAANSTGASTSSTSNAASTSCAAPSAPKKSVTRTLMKQNLADEEFPLASTVTLNKLVESALQGESLPEPAKAPKLRSPTKTMSQTPSVADKSVDANDRREKVSQAVKVIGNAIEEQANKSDSRGVRKTSRAEIQLKTPKKAPDNFKTEVEHYINKPTVNHRTEVVIPVSAPRPPKPLVSKSENTSKERIIPIHIVSEENKCEKAVSPSSSISSARSSGILRNSSSSLSRQSTIESDSGSTISAGEPIRKSAREVIIPIAVEGGGYITPSDTFTKMSSANESETDRERPFSLRSTKRHPRNATPVQPSETAESLSSDEDDNFQLLTAENLFSTLLSRVRSLTQRLNDNDEARKSTAFPHSFFANHSSFFDSPRKITETRSFSRPETAPWRRNYNPNKSGAESASNWRLSRLNSYKNETTPQTIPENMPTTSSRLPRPESFSRHRDFPAKNYKSDRGDGGALNRSQKNSDNKAENKVSEKLSVEEEFDKFFAKYKYPSSSKINAQSSELLSPTTSCAPLPTAIEKASSGLLYSGKSPTPSPCGVRYSKSLTDSQVTSSLTADGNKLDSKPPRRISRFLRPDFYDTPREESKYVIKNEVVRGFRERSLSRQRSLGNADAKSEIDSKNSETANNVNIPKCRYSRSDSVIRSDSSTGMASRNRYSLADGEVRDIPAFSSRTRISSFSGQIPRYNKSDGGNSSTMKVGESRFPDERGNSRIKHKESRFLANKSDGESISAIKQRGTRFLKTKSDAENNSSVDEGENRFLSGKTDGQSKSAKEGQESRIPENKSDGESFSSVMKNNEGTFSGNKSDAESYSAAKDDECISSGVISKKPESGSSENSNFDIKEEPRRISRFYPRVKKTNENDNSGSTSTDIVASSNIEIEGEKNKTRLTGNNNLEKGEPVTGIGEFKSDIVYRDKQCADASPRRISRFYRPKSYLEENTSSPPSCDYLRKNKSDQNIPPGATNLSRINYPARRLSVLNAPNIGGDGASSSSNINNNDRSLISRKYSFNTSNTQNAESANDRSLLLPRKYSFNTSDSRNVERTKERPLIPRNYSFNNARESLNASNETTKNKDISVNQSNGGASQNCLRLDPSDVEDDNNCDESLNDRIRRRSFYSRYNLAGRYPTPPSTPTVAATSTIPRRTTRLPVNLRSQSAEYRNRRNSHI